MPKSPATSMLDDLRLERRTAALAVRRWGEKFRPIFERMDREVRERESVDDALQRAIEAAE